VEEEWAGRCWAVAVPEAACLVEVVLAVLGLAVPELVAAGLLGADLVVVEIPARWW
jgi:hypothetical protein